MRYNNGMDSNPEMHEILKEAREIKKYLALSNSPLRRFLLGIINGFGTIIGATIVVALLISILSLLANFGVFTNFNGWLIETLRG